LNYSTTGVFVRDLLLPAAPAAGNLCQGNPQHGNFLCVNRQTSSNQMTMIKGQKSLPLEKELKGL